MQARIISPTVIVKMCNISRIVFDLRFIFKIFTNGHIRNAVLTLPNVAKVDIENGNVA